MKHLRPAVCQACGDQWDDDPALLVRCPTCQAPPGILCRRPSGHDCDLHMERDQAAVDAGVLQMCSAGPTVMGLTPERRDLATYELATQPTLL